MGKLLQMDGPGSRKRNRSRHKNTKPVDAGQSRPEDATPTGIVVLFTGVRYERRASPSPAFMAPIIANNNFKNG